VSGNSQRNEAIYPLWEQGLTVDQIALQTGIPRSTVGYYIRKFNKSAKRGEAIVFPRTGHRNPKQLALGSLTKSMLLNSITEMISKKDCDTLCKYLMVWKLLKELSGDLLLTKEEADSLPQTFHYILEQFIKLSAVKSG
jgi:hypothetical protein